MSKPIVHARSSAHRFGGHPDLYLPVHQLMDSSKTAHATIRHRAVLHHRTGALIVEAVTGPVLVAGPVSTPTASVAEQHVVEDLGFYPALSDYLDAVDRDRLSKVRTLSRVPWTNEAQCRAAVARWGGSAEDYAKVHRFMDLADVYAGDDPAARLVTHHAFGCFLAEAALGLTLTNGDGREVHVRDVAERHVINELNCIPDLGEWLAVLPCAPWMAGARLLRNRHAD